jgi:hypothetical protein
MWRTEDKTTEKSGVETGRERRRGPTTSMSKEAVLEDLASIVNNCGTKDAVLGVEEYQLSGAIRGARRRNAARQYVKALNDLIEVCISPAAQKRAFHLLNAPHRLVFIRLSIEAQGY